MKEEEQEYSIEQVAYIMNCEEYEIRNCFKSGQLKNIKPLKYRKEGHKIFIPKNDFIRFQNDLEAQAKKTMNIFIPMAKKAAAKKAQPAKQTKQQQKPSRKALRKKKLLVKARKH